MSKGFEVITVEYPYPLEKVDQLLDVYDQILSMHPNVKLTILGRFSYSLYAVQIMFHECVAF